MSVFAVLVSAAMVGQTLPTDAKHDSLATDPAAATATVERPFHEIDEDIRDAMRQEATAESAAQQAAAVERLCELHWELIGDSRLALSPTLKEYRSKLYTRLVRVKTKLQQQAARDARSRSKAEKEQLAEIAATSQSLAESMSAVAATAGGPASLVAGGGQGKPVSGNLGGGAVNADHGQVLIDLIVKTISPEHWEENGGPGAIFYWANFHALVITATDEVHGRVGGVLDGLREAGGG